MKTKKTCADEVQQHFNERMEDIRTLYNAEDQKTKELGSLYDYGLCIDVVERGTFSRNQRTYARYQLSWGGPSEEFRIKENGDVEFWFMDWFDGAKVDVTGEDANIIKNIVESVVGEEFNIIY